MRLPFKLPKLGTKAGLIIVTLAAVTIAYVADNFVSFLTLAERTVEDIRVASALPTEPQDPDIVIVGITEDTLKQFPYREPVDHAFLADLLKFIRPHAGANLRQERQISSLFLGRAQELRNTTFSTRIHEALNESVLLR